MRPLEQTDILNGTAFCKEDAKTNYAGVYKSRLHPSIARWFVFALDLCVASLVGVVTLYYEHASVLDISLRTALPYMLFPIAAMLGLSLSGAYGLSFSRSINQHLVRALNGVGAGLMVLAATLWSLSSAPHKYIAPLFLIWAAIGGVHMTYVLLMKHLFKLGHLSEKVVVIGATEKAQKLITNNRFSGDLRVLGVFDDRAERSPHIIENVPVLGKLDDLMVWDRLPEVDRIVVTITSDARDRVREVIDRLRVLPHRIVLMFDLSSFSPETSEISSIGASPAAYVSGRPTNLKKLIIKRVTDLSFGFGLLVLFSPLMLVIAALIKLEDGGPVFFRQLRHGFNNELIRVWKFRSMTPDEKATERMSSQTQENDPRVTKIGDLIRRTSLDELPQLFNVILGNMSLVGPRPHAVGMTAESTMVHEIVGGYAHRHRSKPGLTGWAQINGSRGPVHTHNEVKERVRLDMEYLERSSFFFDIAIMLKTAPCLLGDYSRAR